MKIKFDFGKTQNGDLNAMFHILSSIIHGISSSNGLTFGGCTMYVNFYDSDGRIVEVANKLINPDTQEVKYKKLAYLIRNKRFTRNENNASREYCGESHGLYKYWLYEDDVFISEHTE